MSAKRSKAEAPAAPKHQFTVARRAGVPLIAYETGDQEASMQICIRALNGKSDETPIFAWDCLRGPRPLTPAGHSAMAQIGNPEDLQVLPVFLATLAQVLPEAEPAHIRTPDRAIIFVCNAQRFLDDAATVQGINNLRNPYKAIGATLVLLGPGFTLPVEIKDDTVRIDEPSPTAEDIGRIIGSCVEDFRASVATFPDPDVAKVTDTLLGYRAEFGVEQSLALSASAAGLDLDKLWDLKVQNLRQTAGLDVSLPKVGFAGLAGCEGAKFLLGLFLRGKAAPRAVLLWDEIEKMCAGSTGGDLSGTSQAMIEQFLSWTELRKVQGLLLVGIPGGGKTRTAECTAGEAQVPLLRASMSSVKGSLVGQSEQNMRNLLRAVDNVAQGQTLMIATCNSLESLAPEVMARFKLGIMFYDYPSDVESSALWDYYRDKYEITEAAPTVRNWVGREIESCCHRAWLFGCTLAEAAATVVPVAVANAQRMEALRQSANGRFLSAAKPGPYTYQAAESRFAPPPAPSTGRKVTL